jgi:hypothetical protein
LGSDEALDDPGDRDHDAIAVMAATDGTAGAEAKCKVRPAKPLVKKLSNRGGGEYFLWGRA